MPTRQELDALKAALLKAIDDVKVRVTADIQALRDQIAGGAQITDQDLADMQAGLDEAATIDPASIPAPTT